MDTTNNEEINQAQLSEEQSSASDNIIAENLATDTPSTLAKQINVKLLKSAVREKSKEQLRRIGKTAKVHGFRTGKVPLHILQQYYGHRADEEAMSVLLDSEWRNEIKEKNITFAGEPQIKPGPVDDEYFSFDFHYEAYPEFDLVDLSSCEVEHQAYQLHDDDINKTINRMREQVASYQTSNEAAKIGDLVKIDFAGTIDGVEFEGGSAKDFQFTLGSQKMLPEFEQGVVGMNCGEEKTIFVNFPEDYIEDLQGKTAQFVITLHQVESKILPEVDAQFIKNLGIESGEYQDLLTEVSNNVKREVKRRIELNNRAKTFQLLIEKHQEFPLPRTLILDNVKSLYMTQMEQFAELGLTNPERYIKFDSLYDKASNQVRLNLVLDKIISQSEKNFFSPNEEEVKQLINEDSAGFENPQEFAKWAFQDQKHRQQFFTKAIEIKLVKFIDSKLKINLSDVNFDELMLNTTS